MYITLAILSLIGIVNTLYLIKKTSGPEPLICPLGSDCNAVLHSKWSKTFGIKNDILGLLYYFHILAIALVLSYTNLFNKDLMTLLIITSTGGFLFSLYLTYLQLFKLKNVCLYCLLSAFVTTLILVTAILLK